MSRKMPPKQGTPNKVEEKFNYSQRSRSDRYAMVARGHEQHENIPNAYEEREANSEIFALAAYGTQQDQNREGRSRESTQRKTSRNQQTDGLFCWRCLFNKDDLDTKLCIPHSTGRIHLQHCPLTADFKDRWPRRHNDFCTRHNISISYVNQAIRHQLRIEEFRNTVDTFQNGEAVVPMPGKTHSSKNDKSQNWRSSTMRDHQTQANPEQGRTTRKD